MTPHQEVKEKYGYQKNAPLCANCKHFEPNSIMLKGGEVKQLREFSVCGIGWFRVSKKSVCNKHIFITVEKNDNT